MQRLAIERNRAGAITISARLRATDVDQPTAHALERGLDEAVHRLRIEPDRVIFRALSEWLAFRGYSPDIDGATYRW